MKKKLLLLTALGFLLGHVSCQQQGNEETTETVEIEPEMREDAENLEKELEEISSEIDSLTKSLEE